MTRMIDNAVAVGAVRLNGIAGRMAVVASSHTVIDVYALLVPPLLGVLEVRCRLEPEETAWILGIGSIASGISQPVAAWLSDKLDSRIFGAIGLAVAAICLSSIGIADSFATLFALYVVGTIGVGIFHPTGASSMGQLADSMRVRRRSVGVTIFFVCGMVGAFTGSILGTRLTLLSNGFTILQYLMIPGLIVAVFLNLAIRRVPHRQSNHRELAFERTEISHRWGVIWLLYLSNVFRFTVNMACVYLFVRWAQAYTSAMNPSLDASAVASASAPLTGNLNAFQILGMAIGGLSAGTLVKKGREKWPIVLVPILAAPAIAMFMRVGVEMAYVLSLISGIGFAAMVPVSLSVAQRLLPHRTSLASSLMLGGAWFLAFLGPLLAEYCLGTLKLSLEQTFIATAVILFISGLICLPMSGKLLRETADSE